MKFEVLVGKTLNEVIGAKPDSKEIIFVTNDGETYYQRHDQDCCEEVSVLDIEGDIQDIIGSLIILAEVATNKDLPVPEGRYSDESYTWTFYRIATVKGLVVIRWFGSSNGYYSEDVSFFKLERIDGSTQKQLH